MSAEILRNKFAALSEGARIRAVIDHGIESTREGRIHRQGFTTRAGHSYAALVCMPNDPRTDIPTIATTAWFTSTEGHNEHTARVFMRHGNPVVMVGAEGSEHTKSSPFGITLARSAAAVLQFAREAAYKTEIDCSRRYLIGESRGAMVGMGIIALAETFDQEVLFADLTAPCFPRRFHAARDILTLAKHVSREPRTVIDLAGKLPIKLLFHYPATVDPNPGAFVHQLAIGTALFSGEAGELARAIPREQPMHVTTYDDDAASMHKVWVELFEHHANIRVTPLAGSHLSLADPQTLRYLIARNNIFQEQIAAQGSVDAQAIFEEAHQKVKD